MLGAVFSKLILVPIFAFMSFSHGEDQIPKEDRIVLDVISETADLVEKKYDASRCGIGMSGHFKNIEISFQVNKELNRHEARLLLLDCVEDLLGNINTSEELRPYLKTYPFKYENVGIELFFRCPDGKKIFHPNICIAAAASYGVYFKTDDPENKYQFKEIHRETHEEAIAKVKAKHPEFKFGSWEKIRISDRSSKIE